MPAKWFIAGDKKYLISDVLSGKVEMEDFPMPYLKAVGDEREWDGYLHVTDLYNGKRETFLKYTTLYSIDPDGSAFAVAGQFKHNVMEDPDNPFHEKELIYRNIKGKLDILDQHGEEYWIVDYKNQGAFAVRKFQGWQKKDIPDIDDFGVQKVFKSGPRTGIKKTKVEWFCDSATADRSQYEFQLNLYKKAIEENLGITVSKLKIFFMLRDGGLAATKDQGLSKNTYYEDVKILDDKTIDDYIDSKSGTAQNIIDFRATEDESQDERWEALKRLCPGKCSDKERWFNSSTGVNTKCNKYCSVSEICRSIP